MKRNRGRSPGLEPGNGESDEERRKRVIRETLEQHQGQDTESQAKALDEAMLAEPTQPTTDWLWQVLVVGLVGLLLLALCGLIALAVLGKDTEVLVTVFASILSGLLGLFVRSPGEGSS